MVVQVFMILGEAMVNTECIISLFGVREKTKVGKEETEKLV